MWNRMPIKPTKVFRDVDMIACAITPSTIKNTLSPPKCAITYFVTTIDGDDELRDDEIGEVNVIDTHESFIPSINYFKKPSVPTDVIRVILTPHERVKCMYYETLKKLTCEGDR